MKKFLMVCIGIGLGIIALSSLGNLIGLVISVIVAYFSLKQFLKSDSLGGKIVWAIIGLMGVSATFANLPALAGVLAIYLLYVGYKHWKKEEKPAKATKDPFTNFDQQWNEIQGKFK